MKFSNYDLGDHEATCSGFIMIDDVQVFGTFYFTYDAWFDTDGYPINIKEVKVTSFEKGSVDFVKALNDADIWCQAEDYIATDLKDEVLVPRGERNPDDAYMDYCERHYHG